jgi:hypothetical protein
MIYRRRVLGYGAGLAAVVMLAVACASGPSPAQAQQAATGTRTLVAREYWDVYNSLSSVTEPGIGGGFGFFSVCPGQPASQVAYNVSSGIAAPHNGVATPSYVALLEKTLRAQGWGAFGPNSGGYLLSTKQGYKVSLKPQTGNQRFFVALAVGGPCVTTGTTFASQVESINENLNDSYPVSASARPVPTDPVPTP